MRSLVWFRRDLRVHDHSALYHAAKAGQVIGLFVLTPGQWLKHHDAPAKVHFWLGCLRELRENLRHLGIPLLIRSCNSFQGVPEILRSVVAEFDCQRVDMNWEYEVWESERDGLVEAACDQAGVEVRGWHDRVIVPPHEISTNDGRFYSVFTPYRRVWDKMARDHAEVLPVPSKQTDPGIPSDGVPMELEAYDFSDCRDDLWVPGETEANRRLEAFTRKIEDYHQARDVPSQNGTSLLSPYLTAGAISPRQCLQAALQENQGRIRGQEGTTTWISELTWRDFYTHVMTGFPRVSMDRPFQLKTESIQWLSDDRGWTAWRNGCTGYPIIDAGMRQLNQTGWMHNRLRMVTAMFLTKHLLIDWRRGEQYFMSRLVDGDLAANNGGWQWSASTGTDAVPYFRIFNPFSQSKRFDPEGAFIKRLCPELAPIPPSALHDPIKLQKAIGEHDIDYPAFIVDHKTARERALATFKAIR